MRVLLVNPRGLEDVARHIPYDLCVLAAIADELGHDVSFLDLDVHRVGVEVVRKEFSRKLYDVIAFMGSIKQYKFIKEAVSVAREAQPESLLVGLGDFVTRLRKKVMKWLKLDVGCFGEPEQTWVEVLDHSEDRAFKGVKGVIYRGSGGLVQNGPRRLIGKKRGFFKSLDELPFPALEMLPLQAYFMKSSLPYSTESLMSQRRLSILSERDYGKLRFQSAKYVVDLIKHWRLKYAVDFVHFLGEHFCANVKRCLEICRLLEDEDLVDVVKWGCFGDITTVSYQLLQRMKDCGCRYVIYDGVSADPRMLKGRHIPMQMQGAIDGTLKAGLNPIMDFQIGFPEEDVESISRTVEFMIDNQIECEPSFVTPLPNSELFKQNKHRILQQYETLEAYLQALAESKNKLMINLTNFNDVELIGLRQLMIQKDLERIKSLEVNNLG